MSYSPTCRVVSYKRYNIKARVASRRTKEKDGTKKKGAFRLGTTQPDSSVGLMLATPALIARDIRTYREESRSEGKLLDI